MICLAVSSNGKRPTVAGDPDAIVQAILASGTHVGVPPRPGFALSVTGATPGGFAEWVNHDLFVGDEVFIKIIESPDLDTPTRFYTEAEFDDLGGKKGLLLARGEYGALKRRMRFLEDQYGDQLVDDADA
jgi:hypothetical protein